MKKTTLIISIILFTTVILLTGCKTENNNAINTNNTNIENEADKSKNTVNNIAITENKKESSKEEFETGKYIIITNNSETAKEINDGGDEEIVFDSNNKFKSYIGWGMSISGDYKIEDEKTIKCNVTTFYSEYGPEQEIKANITLKIKEDNIIEVTEASEKFEIQIVGREEEEWILTEEHKEIYLTSFTTGNTFGLSK